MTAKIWHWAAWIILSPSFAHAESYFPITDGWAWSYRTDLDGVQEVAIQGVTEVIGTAVAIRDVQVQVGTESDHHENYWSNEGSGTFLHGATSHSGGFSLAYDPPILWIDPPLYVGKTWSTTTQAYSDLDGTVPLGAPFIYSLGVIGFAVIDVPAGSFVAYQIAQVTLANAASEEFDVLGRTMDESAGGATTYQWVVLDVGIVREVGAYLELFDLVSYGVPVSVESTSWSRIKSLYRE